MFLEKGEVEWLNEVPVHWKVARLKFIAHSIQTGPFGSQLHSDDYSPGGIPVVNPLHLRNGRIYPDFDVAIDDETWQRLSRHDCKKVTSFLLDVVRLVDVGLSRQLKQVGFAVLEVCVCALIRMLFFPHLSFKFYPLLELPTNCF
jgi:hypothetical protein